MSGMSRRVARAQAREAVRERAKARTRQGLCSRCGERAERHPTGVCPDGLGSFTWAMGNRDMDALIQRLDEAQALSRQRQGEQLTRDEQRVLDALVEFTLGVNGSEEGTRFAAAALLIAPDDAPRPGLRPEQLAEATGLPLHHVRSILDRLAEKGYLTRNAERPS